MEGFDERCCRWQRAIEGILIEVGLEKDCNGLLIGTNTSGVVSEIRNIIHHIKIAKMQSKNNPSVATLIPGSISNEEQEIK